jgi:hypothetical protein
LRKDVPMASVLRRSRRVVKGSLTGANGCLGQCTTASVVAFDAIGGAVDH